MVVVDAVGFVGVDCEGGRENGEGKGEEVEWESHVHGVYMRC